MGYRSVGGDAGINYEYSQARWEERPREHVLGEA
jgi:hypothetical protein